MKASLRPYLPADAPLLALLFDTAPIGALLIDTDGRVRRANAAMIALAGALRWRKDPGCAHAPGSFDVRPRWPLIEA